METKIEKYLLESIRKRDCVLILGSAFNTQSDTRGAFLAQTLDLKEHFLKYFKDIFTEEMEQVKSWMSDQIAEEIQQRRSREILYSCIKNFVEALPREPLPVHRNLVKICVSDPQIFEAIITHNWDRLLEKAFDDSPLEERIHYKVLSKDSDMKGYKHSLINILKLRGDIYTAAESMTITETDIDSYVQTHPLFVARLRCLLTTKTVILVGFNEEDFGLLHDGILRGLNAPLQAYVVFPTEVKLPRKSQTLLRLNQPQIQANAEQFMREVYAFLNETAVGFPHNIRKNESIIGWYREFGYLCDENLSRLSDAIIEKWPHLKEAIVIDSETNESMFMKLGRFSARFFENNVKDGQTVALSCGRTLEYLVESLRENYYTNLRVFSTIVLFLDSFSKKPPMFLVEMLINKYKSENVTGVGYHFPPLTKFKNSGFQVALVKQELKRVVKEADHIFLGIRGLDYGLKADKEHRSTLRFIDLVEERNRQQLQDELRKLGYIAIQAHNPLNADGESFFDFAPKDFLESKILRDLTEKIVTISPTWLKEEIASNTSKNIVTIASGVEKLEPIRAVLDGKILNVLIIDQTIAEALVGPQPVESAEDVSQLEIKKKHLVKVISQKWRNGLGEIAEEKKSLANYIEQVRRGQGTEAAEDVRKSEAKKLENKENGINKRYQQLKDSILNAASMKELEHLQKDIDRDRHYAYE